MRLRGHLSSRSWPTTLRLDSQSAIINTLSKHCGEESVRLPQIGVDTLLTITDRTGIL